MKYRRFGRLDWMVSALGFGAMRLPTVGGDKTRIDEPSAIKMIRYAIDHGVNYIDTAYPYHGGNSEIVVGKALEDGYREKVRIATKMPIWQVNSKDDLDKIFNEQLRRLKVDYIDFYLIHALNRERWAKTQELNVLDWAENLIDENKIGYLGFSFHDEFSVFKDIVDGYDWTFCQILYNFMDENFQAGKRGLMYAASKGLAVVIMEPLRGGMLALPPPPEVQSIWDETGVRRTPVEWALLWVWNHPEVSVALSGMSSLEQVIENIRIADKSAPNILTEKELKAYIKVRERYQQLGFIGCTGCHYCVPCPRGVSIPEIFSLFNEFLKKHRDGEARRKVIQRYQEKIKPENRAKRCVECGECEKKCPQSLPIRELLKRAAQIFERE